MTGFPLAIADANRAEQLLLLRRSRSLFDGYNVQTDDDSIVWATKIVGGHRFAVTWLGPGWVFDPVAQDRRMEDLERRRAEMRNATPDRHRQELDGVLARLRLGVMAERLLWLIHQQLLRHRTSLLRLPDILLADIIWGRQRRLPSHWRQELLNVLNGLTWLHVANADDEGITFGPSSVLLTHVADLHGKPGDDCAEGCDKLTEARHHHILINIGRGFLGVLEQFAREEDGGVRSYLFPVGSRSRRQSSDLRRVGKSGHVVTVYLAAKLGDRTACDGFTNNQHRLLQAIVREATRNTRGDRQSITEAEVFRGNAVPTTNGKGSIHCELLDPEGEYVGFNGNKLLKGRGYLVASPGGWRAKAGYSPEQVVELFADLEVLASKLSLIPVGLRQGSRSCLSLGQMSLEARSPRGVQQMRDLHLRIYAPADYLARWNQVFGWVISPELVTVDPALTVGSAMNEKGVTQRSLAEGMKVDPSLLSKVLRGKKRWPEGWLDRATTWLHSQGTSQPSSSGQ